MTRENVLSIILDEKKKVDNLKSSNDLCQWFWNVGFRNIEIDEENKRIICEVSRPNKFISKFRKPIINFLIYLSRHVFSKQGYTFELKKYTNDEYYTLFRKYIEK